MTFPTLSATNFNIATGTKSKTFAKVNIESMDSTTNAMATIVLADKKMENMRKKSELSTWDKDSSALSTMASQGKAQARQLKKQSQIAESLKHVREAQDVDVVFMLDCTGSMQPYVDGVKVAITDLRCLLEKQYPGSKFKFAFVGYKDFDKKSDSLCYLDFTQDNGAFVSFVSRTRADGGGDAPEDVFGGLNVALSKLSWRESSTKVLIHYADAPCHGNEFHSCSMIDSYPDGDPNGLTVELLMQEVAKLQILYNFGYIVPESTNQMIQVFNQVLSKVSDNQLQIQQFDGQKPANITLQAYTSIMASIISTIALKESGKSLRCFKIEKGEPNWGDIASREAKLFSMKLPLSTKELLKSDYSSSVCENKIRCKVAPQPFAFGSLRLAYHARLIQPDRDDKQVVIKQFKHIGIGENAIKRYLEDLECQTVAAHFAKQFKGVYPLSPIAFAKTKVMKFYTLKAEQVSVEPFMPGEYKKWSNNSGIWIKDDDGSLMAAFSHWTFVESRGKMLVCDLQGVKNSDGFFLTDPAIHSVKVLKFGRSNLGKDGMRLFFESHTCGEICQSLKIENKCLEAFRGETSSGSYGSE